MVATPAPAVRPPAPAAHASSWRKTFVTGFLLWIASVVVTGLTSNLNVVPTVVLLGSFLVPATAVIWYLDQYHSDVVTPALAARAFIVGGVVGALAASILEALLASNGLLLFFGVGLVEELAKLIALMLIARRLGQYRVRDGIVLGAAVGFGFAALESSGYALNALIVQEGRTVVFSLGSLVTTELLRGILAPVGHGLWTALVGGALFGASRAGRMRLAWSVVGVYLLVALLHGLWDAAGLLAALLTTIYYALPMPGDVWLGVPRLPMEAQFVTYLGFYFGTIVVLSLIGIGLLRRRWQSAAPAAASPAHEVPLQAA